MPAIVPGVTCPSEDDESGAARGPFGVNWITGLLEIEIGLDVGARDFSPGLVASPCAAFGGELLGAGNGIYAFSTDIGAAVGSDGNAFVLYPDGHRQRFYPVDGSGGAFATKNEDRSTLTVNAASITLQTHDLLLTLDAPAQVDSAQGYMLGSVRRLFGADGARSFTTERITRDANGFTTRIESDRPSAGSGGRLEAATFQYTSGVLTEVDSFTGDKVTITQTSDGFVVNSPGPGGGLNDVVSTMFTAQGDLLASIAYADGSGLQYVTSPATGQVSEVDVERNATPWATYLLAYCSGSTRMAGPFGVTEEVDYATCTLPEESQYSVFRIVGVVQNGGEAETASYQGPACQVSSVVHDDTTWRFAYDPGVRQLTSVVRGYGGASETLYSVASFDASGELPTDLTTGDGNQRAQVQYDAIGQPTSIAWGNDTMTVARSVSGTNVVEATTLNGRALRTRVFDAHDNLVEDDRGPQKVSYGLDASDRLTTITWPGMSQSASSLDVYGRPGSIAASYGPLSGVSTALTYNRFGPTSATNSYAGSTTGGLNLGYTAIGQPASVSLSGPDGSTSFFYGLQYAPGSSDVAHVLAGHDSSSSYDAVDRSTPALPAPAQPTCN